MFKPNLFYIDRVWLKAYPKFFSNLRVYEYMEIYRTYRASGVFQEMTDFFFKVYRSINCLKIAFKKGIPVDGPEKCEEVLRYGERDFANFSVFGDTVFIDGGVSLSFSKDQILESKFLTYTRVSGDRVVYEKVFYIPINSYMRIAVKPYLERFTPPMIRIFLNAIEYAKQFVKMDYDGYQYVNENWVDPEVIDFKEFLKRNYELLGSELQHIISDIRKLWEFFFGREEELKVKVTQVELCFDSYVDKIKVLNALRLVASRSKTLKVDTVVDRKSGFYSWGNDVGLKYYLTVRKGFQIKLYSKAIKNGMLLNRLELTFNVNTDANVFKVGDLFNDEVVRVIDDINLAMKDERELGKVIELIKPYVRARKNKELHYAFLLDLFLHGQVRGSGVYRELARLYKQYGLIEVSGRGINSVYRLKPEYLAIHKRVREVFEEFTNYVREVRLSEIELKIKKPNNPRPRNQ